MTSSDYIPTKADVLAVLAHVDPLHEVRHHTSRYSFRFIDFSGQQSGPVGWYSISSSVSSIIYCVNLAEYDQIEMGRKTTGLVAALDLFGSIMESDFTAHACNHALHTHERVSTKTGIVSLGTTISGLLWRRRQWTCSELYLSQVPRGLPLRLYLRTHL